jgi:hypothetical protein
MTVMLTAASVRLEDTESLLATERSGRWHSVLVEKDGARGRSSVEEPRRGEGRPKMGS